MKRPLYTTKFSKDLKRQQKRGKDTEKLKTIVAHICEHGDASEKCRPHNLSGNWNGYRECHIGPDWLLIYTVDETSVIFHRTGTHSDLF